jgi:hypothetical protein
MMNVAAGQFPVRVTGGGATGTLQQTIVGGTITQTVGSVNLNVGTIGTINSNLGTIATLNTNTGTIGTFASNTGTIGTVIPGTVTTVNSIPGSALSTNAVFLGGTKITSSQTGIVAGTNLTNGSITITVPSGGRVVKITGYTPQFTSSASGNRADFYIMENGTQLAASYGAVDTVGWGGAVVIWYGTTSAGAHTYNLKASRSIGAGTNIFFAAADSPAFIIAELI